MASLKVDGFLSNVLAVVILGVAAVMILFLKTTFCDPFFTKEFPFGCCTKEKLYLCYSFYFLEIAQLFGSSCKTYYPSPLFASLPDGDRSS